MGLQECHHDSDVDTDGDDHGGVKRLVLAAAVAWEVLECVLGGYFTVYGIDDIVTDRIANTVGATVIAIGGAGPVDRLVAFLRNRWRLKDDQKGWQAFSDELTQISLDQR